MMILYPFDGEDLLKKSKKYKRALLEDGTERTVKKIAVLGGATTHEIVRLMEVFLLDKGIAPVFYESEYAQYYEDAVFGNPELDAFCPDVIYVCTSYRNLKELPTLSMSAEEVETLTEETVQKYVTIWEKCHERYHCPVIQNNFEFPSYRLQGNREAVDEHGTVHFVNTLNMRLAEASKKQERYTVYIHDLQYLSATFGLDRWQDEALWNLYKYPLSMQAVPTLSYSVATMIGALFGKNKKALALDLDNTLWGGIVGDDGAENLEIGEETATGETFKAFQSYVKQLKEIGVMLTVNSKNEEENALSGLNHPEGVLRPEDFAIIKANWEPKSKNLIDTANALSILPDAMVFADDNPAEREIVRAQVKGAAVPELTEPENYIRIIDRAGYFEVLTLSDDDRKRNQMMQENLKREALQATFADYGEYLTSLAMQAEIKPFDKLYFPRITQLTNKSNQFNLTTRRYTQDEIAQAAEDADCITLYGKLADKFGDNGIVSVIIGSVAMQLTEEERDAAGRITKQAEPTGRKALLIDLWLMSCSVLKRDMEFAMMDALVTACRENGIPDIFGYYYPTAKNKMVENFYEGMGFTKVAEDEKGNTTWKFEIPQSYTNKNRYIEVLK